jgi:hypothetical protein
MPEPERSKPQGTVFGALLPMLVLALLCLALGGGVLLFPRIAAYMARQDCVASGHTNCG